MALTEQDYRNAASALPDGVLGRTFGRCGLSCAEVSAIHTKTLFNTNAEDMGMLSESVAGLQKRGMGLAKLIAESQDVAKRKEKASTNDLVLLDLLNQHLAPIERALADKYGENFIEKMAEKYLDAETIDQINDIEDPAERKAAFRAELARRHQNGGIVIEEADVIEWLDRYNDFTNDEQAKLDAAQKNGLDGTEDLRIQFAVKASGTETDAEAAQEAIDKPPISGNDANAMLDFMKS